jgi:hypothetical protein
MRSTRSISKQASGSSGAGCAGVLMVVFGLIFGIVGVGVAYGISGAPLLNVFRARSWQPAHCEITFSQVTASASSARSSSETSRVNIQYRYAWNDKTYTGTRYDFTVGADNFGDAGKAAIVAQHRPDQTVACFVDPNDPTQSVINRDMKWGYLIGAAFGAPFALVPVLIFWSVTRARGRARLAQAAATVAASPVFAGG